MKIPEGIKTCVAFVGLRMADGTFRMAGTVYFIGRDDNGSNLNYAVTAKHVIEGIKSKGLDQVYLRLNMNNGNATWFSTEMGQWKYHKDPNVDIATLGIRFPPEIDQKFYPLSGAMTNEVKEQHQIEEGDEVFVTGLFRHHHGDLKNIPIVRVGNISAIPEEKIQTRHHLMTGYLIEARSIGGLSGSPVYVNLGLHRHINGSIKQSNSGPIYFLFGMIYGHYDINTSEIDEIIEDNPNLQDRVNTGIAIVTPAIKLIEHLNEL
jgi:hypothetical protein